MNTIVYYLHSIGTTLGLLRWYESIEILCYVGFVYYFSLWLSADKQKNLVMPFYAYCGALCASQLIGLYSLHMLLLYGAPCAVMVFILFHQQVLQKNFVTLRRYSVSTVQSASWVETLISMCLYAMNKNKNLSIAIEQNDILQPFVKSSCSMNAPVQEQIFEFIIDSTRLDPEKVIWIQNTGYILGANVTWYDELSPSMIDGAYGNCTPQQIMGIALTQKTDAIVITLCPQERTFTITMQGTIINSVTATMALNMLKKMMVGKPSKKVNSQAKGIYNDYFTTQSVVDQKQL